MSEPVDGGADGLVAGRFRVLGLLGSGATASVYEALDTVAGGRVAVKVLHPHLAEQPALREAFLREAETVSGLSHPSLCAVIGSGIHDAEGAAETWTAWQLAPGTTLGEHVRERGVLAPAAAVDVAARVLAGLGELHRAGLVHRDVSPSNIVVDVDAAGRVRDARVIDFGLVDVAGSTTRGSDVLRSADGDGVVGNVQYAAPELLRGEGVGPAADLYELAGVLYFALVGTPPFARDTADATIRAHQSAAPPTASVRVSGVPVAVDRAIVRAMLKDPEARFGSAQEMRTALLAAVAGRSASTAAVDRTTRTRAFAPATAAGAAAVPAVDPVPSDSDGEPEASRPSSPWLWVLGVLALALVVVAVVALTPRPQGPRAADETVQTVVPASTAPPAAQTPTPTPTVPPVSMTEIPLVEGLSQDAATRALEAAGLAIGEVRGLDSPRASGTVLSSDPAPGTRVVGGQAVRLDVASGANSVPFVAGASEQAAVDALTAAGLVPVVTRVESDAASGTVLTSEPPAGQSVPLGTRVVVTVAIPPAPATIPSTPPTPAPTRTPSATPTPAPTP